MKTNAEVVSDFLQTLRRATGDLDRVELDYAIEALDALAEDLRLTTAEVDDLRGDNEYLQGEIDEVKYDSECTAEDLRDNVSEMEDTLSKTEDALTDATEVIHTVERLLNDWKMSVTNAVTFQDSLEQTIANWREARNA